MAIMWGWIEIVVVIILLIFIISQCFYCFDVGRNMKINKLKNKQCKLYCNHCGSETIHKSNVKIYNDYFGESIEPFWYCNICERVI